MKTIIITGSSGLIGSESVEFFSEIADHIIGIDNNMRARFFGSDASTEWNKKMLEEKYPNYTHKNIDIRDKELIKHLFSEHGPDIDLIIHTAAQPSHDWAAKDPDMDFTVNAYGTLNLLEATRHYCPEAPFIFTSTNKVYGDNPNYLPLKETDKRWELDQNHPYFKHGIDENFSIDNTKHSVFGASKTAADILTQEYGKYFGLYTGIFRGGCLTGPKHAGTRLHGFLSYLVKCAVKGEPYVIYGYKGKQVRDNIHSYDLVNMFWHFYNSPRKGEVYNAGGSRFSNCSMLEAIDMVRAITGCKLNYTYSDQNRIGDHIWWISDVNKFKKHYPEWEYKYSLHDIITQIYEGMTERVSE